VPRLKKATCPNCGADFQLDPALEFATCRYCGTRSFVETRRRPVTEVIRIEQHPVIRVRTARSGGCLSSLVGSALMLIGAAWVYSRFQTLPYRQWVSYVAHLASAQPSALVANFGALTRAPQAAVDYFTDPMSAERVFEQRLGSPIRAAQFLLYPSHAVLQAQDPKKHDHMDSYTLAQGSILQVTPIRAGSNLSRVEQQLFSLSDVHLSQLPELIRSAEAVLSLQEAKPTHVIIEKPSSTVHAPVVIRVYVSSARASGYVEYSTDGKKLRVVK
jgi:DNA-directed RNA polymerase subunit RPC12/RpoP